MTAEQLAAPQAVVPSLRAAVLSGSSLVTALRGELTNFLARSGAPVSGRGPWLLAAIAARPEVQPFAVVLRDRRGGLRAAMLMADEVDGRGRIRTTLLGTDGIHRGCIAATDLGSAGQLASAVEEALLTKSHLGAVSLGPLPADDPLVQEFCCSSAYLSAASADPIPVIRRRDRCPDSPDATVATTYLRDSMARTVRKARNRLARDGLEARLGVVTDPVAIRGSLPLLIEHHRARDHAQGRSSALDDPAGAASWTRRVDALLQEGLRLLTLALDGELASYVLGVQDGDVFRLFEGRFVGVWARYAAGRLLETAVLQHVLDNPRLCELDWMTAIAPDTLLAQTHADPMVQLVLPTV